MSVHAALPSTGLGRESFRSGILEVFGLGRVLGLAFRVLGFRVRDEGLGCQLVQGFMNNPMYAFGTMLSSPLWFKRASCKKQSQTSCRAVLGYIVALEAYGFVQASRSVCRPSSGVPRSVKNGTVFEADDGAKLSDFLKPYDGWPCVRPYHICSSH